MLNRYFKHRNGINEDVVIGGAYWHFVLCEMGPILDLKRRPQTAHGMLGEFKGWRTLAFNWALLCFLVNYSWTALLQLVPSAAPSSN